MTTWLITGCSTGLGRALAEAVLAHGDNVVVTARDVTTVQDLADAHPDTALAVALDVTDDEQVAAAVAAAEERFGGVDVLVNNAGYGYRAAVEEGEDDAVRRLFDTHVFGTVRTIKAVLPGHARPALGDDRQSLLDRRAHLARRGPATTRRSRPRSRRSRCRSARRSHRWASPPWSSSPAASGPTSPAGRSPRRPSRSPTTRRRRASGARSTTPCTAPRPATRPRRPPPSSRRWSPTQPPYLLVLGDDAFDGVRAALDALRDEVDAWESVSRSTGFDS